MNFSKKIVISIFIILTLFTIANIIIFVVTGSEPETLIDKVFGFFAVEGGALALIKMSKTKHQKDKNESEENEDEHNQPDPDN